MVQLAKGVSGLPRVSANQLGEFVYGSESKRISILHDNKFGNRVAAPYYGPALNGIRHAFSDGQFSVQTLLEEAALVEARIPKKPFELHKWPNNALALRRFAEISGACRLPPGQHRVVRQNARFILDGVTISVLPDFVTENLGSGFLTYTKLRFSKSKIAADVSEIVLLLLHYYGQRQSRPGLTFDFNRCRVIDCFSKTIIHGHAIGRHRHQQLHEALSLIQYMWPRIEAKDS